MATLRMLVDGNHDMCPICKRNPNACPHSLTQMDKKLWEDYITKIVDKRISKLENRFQNFLDVNDLWDGS